MSPEFGLNFEKYPILDGQINSHECRILTPHIIELLENSPEKESTHTKLLIVSGPPGSGKDTFVNQLLQKCDRFGVPKTATTRPPRASELITDPYIRLSEKEFLEYKDQGLFIETDFHGYWYGSPLSELQRVQTEGKTPIMRIDPNGAESVLNLKKNGAKMFEQTNILYAYIVPPDGYTLFQRLMRRTLQDNGNNYSEALHQTQQRIQSAVMPDLSHLDKAQLILLNHEAGLDTLADEFLATIDSVWDTSK